MSTNLDPSEDRKDMCKILFKELDFFKDRMTILMSQLRTTSIKEETLARLDSSIKFLIRIVDEILRADSPYLNKEDPLIFEVYITNIEISIKNFLKAYMFENNLQNRMENGLKYWIITKGRSIPKYKTYSDSIDKLLSLMYDSLAEKRGLFVLDEKGTVLKDEILEYGYPSVIRAVKFLRNLQYHEIVDVPIDYRTDVKSFGNLFTLSSILILTFRAYVEMLDLWLDTLNRYSKMKLR
jgi:hypothetical protein